MPEHVPTSLLNQSLRGLGRLWRDILPGSRRRGGRPFAPDLPEGDLASLRARIAECLAARGGEVSARQRAAELGDAYLQLAAAGRERFLTLLAEEFGVEAGRVEDAIANYQAAAGEDLASAEERLRIALRSPRVRLLTQFNDLPEGTKFLVDMREDLLGIRDRGPSLRAFDGEFQRLLASWFDPGFLELRRIDWGSPAMLLEKLMAYEAVHEIESWNDLRNRLETDRCCYAFFHHHMPGEPLIFVEVALVKGIAGDVRALLDEASPEVDPQEADTAIFYSISNTQRGLRGISFGSFLIKRVVDDLRPRFPKLSQFVTLSPIPGFGRWLGGLDEAAYAAALGAADRGQLAELSGAESSGALRAHLAEAPWSEDRVLAARYEQPLLRLCAYYLAAAKRGDGPLDPVARFHLGNGARIERLNWLGNDSDQGRAQSAGIMVNYAYRLEDIEKNHEAFATNGAIALSNDVKKLLKR